MRITLDARLVGMPGIGRFITGLWTGLTAIDADVVGLWPRSATGHWLGAQHSDPAGAHLVVRGRPFLPVEQATLPAAIRRVGADVHHAPHLNLPYAARVPLVLTVHDLIAYLDPSKARSRIAGAYYRAAFPLAVRRADVIVAVSQFTARQVTETFGVGADRLRVIEAGIDHEHWRPRSQSEIASVRGRYALPADYLLYVGTAKPHKNLATLCRAHRREHPPLVLAGPTSGELASVGIDPPRAGRWIALGRVPDRALPALYTGARAVVLPSLHEGFGLTPLEAMACNTPAVVSDGGALPETVGDAAIVTPARDVDAWTEALTKVCVDDDVRSRLVGAGRHRVSSLAWSECARQYLEVYRQAVSA